MISARIILDRLRELGSPKAAANAARFFKTGPGQYGEGDLFIGIPVPVLRKLASEYRDLPEDENLALLRSEIHEARHLALFLLVNHFARGDDAARKRIYELYLEHTDHVNNWDLVDSSARGIVGGYLHARSRKPLYRLARSKSLWERRIAIVATFYFIDKHDYDDTLKVAELLLDDGHDLIHKAVGWMLREVGKRDTAVLEAFLKAHHRAMPRTALRYAIERFPEVDRLAYLKGTFDV